MRNFEKALIYAKLQGTVIADAELELELFDCLKSTYGNITFTINDGRVNYIIHTKVTKFVEIQSDLTIKENDNFRYKYTASVLPEGRYIRKDCMCDLLFVTREVLNVIQR